jgi:ribonuclease J
MSFSKCGAFFEEYLKPRYSCTGLKDLLTLKLLPYIDDIYRSDLLRIIGKTPHEEPSVDGVLLSHVHQDHSAYISLLDERIPICSSEVTNCYAESILEAGHRSLETEICSFKERPITDNRSPEIERTFNLLETEKTFRLGSTEIKPFNVDHSVPGAMAFLIHSSDKTLVYTGDLRLHGVRGDLTQRFIDEVAKESVDILLCEGTRIDEKISNSEDYVAQNANKVVSQCDQLVIADFAYKDLYRFLTFYKIAKDNDRKLAISKRHAYLLRKLKGISKLEHIPPVDDKEILIYVDRKRTGQYDPSDYMSWEKDFLDMSNVVDADWVRNNQGKVVVCLTFFDMTELIDILPNMGSIYIHSSSEPHNEEQIIDQQRLDCWLDFFKLVKHHFHASGHASGLEIQKIIQTINPKEVIPIHTVEPEQFRAMHGNVTFPKLEEF